MDALFYTGMLLVLIIGVLCLGVWIFIGIITVSCFMLVWVLGMDPYRVGTIATNIIYRSSTTWELAAVPLFIWMGEIIFRSDLSERIFRGLSPFVSKVPGRLLHTNIAGCTLFAAVCGSTAATTATVGKITTRKLAASGYDEPLALGSLAGAGSLGLLIPPSIVMIVYGILAEVSVSRLFAAGIFPGLMLAGLFSSYIVINALFRPHVVPAEKETFTSRQYFSALLDLLPITVLMVIVLGAIYSGIATPSEAAAIGVAAALLLVLATGQLTPSLIADTLRGALETSVMICTLLMAAALLSTTMGYLHIPRDVATAIASFDLSPMMLIVVLTAFYILMGLFLDGVSIIVMSLPITLPLAIQAGVDPLWFGVFLVLTIELGQVTPPVGFNLFVIQSLTGRSIGRVALYALPFFFIMLLGIAILAAFPRIVTWLPDYLYG